MLLTTVRELETKYDSRTRQLNGYEKLMSVRNEEKGVYGWFPFFQAFTSGFLEKIFKRKMVREHQRILDPFAGSGNTLVACVEFGKEGFGLEVNPLFRFVAKVKTQKHSEEHFAKAERIILRATNENYDVEFPELSSFRRLFDEEVLKWLILLRDKALMEKDTDAASLLLFALASELLNFSLGKRYGKGLHRQERACKRDVNKTILEKLCKMRMEYNELRNKSKRLGKASMAPHGVFEVEKATSIPLIDTIITSPPYCNSSDYVEMYKLELWFLEFVTQQQEFRDLSHKTIRSHLSFNNFHVGWSNEAIEEICDALETMQLWNSRLPLMISGYFDDLHSALAQIRKKLKDNGTMIFIIGNSSYSGVVIPSDLLLAEAAEDLDLSVESIEVARRLKPSPQQRKVMDEYSLRLMRESIVTLSG